MLVLPYRLLCGRINLTIPSLSELVEASLKGGQGTGSRYFLGLRLLFEHTKVYVFCSSL